ncbi:hypothetical protein MTO96_047773 [Rhipicephalus appendiculatus]
MERPRGHVEGTGVEEQLAALFGVKLRHLGEAQVVADAEANLAVRGVERGQAVAGSEAVRFPERYLSGNVDVEEVNFAVLGEHLAVGTVDEAGVVELAVFRFGHGAADEIDAVLSRSSRQHLAGLTGDRLGVLGEVLGAVREAEAFGQAHKLGAARRSLLDFDSGASKVLRFASFHRELDKRDTEAVAGHC